MPALTTEPLTPTVGAAVLDVDHDRLLNDPEIPEATLDALEENGALVFRDLHLDDTTQVEFSKRLGHVEVFGTGENAEIFRVTLDKTKNKAAKYLKGTFDWHIDGMTDDIPIKATLLAAHAVASSGGETEFASTYAAYDHLDDEDKARFEQIRVVHTIAASQRYVTPDPTPEIQAAWDSRPAKTHPLVWKHQSGRKSLVLGVTASHVEGMDFDEGRKFLDELLEWATAPERVYRHDWEVGDLVIWDNRGVLHRATRYDETSPRDMHRTTLTGDEPVQ